MEIEIPEVYNGSSQEAACVQGLNRQEKAMPEAGE
jgi:hypothetical protein